MKIRDAFRQSVNGEPGATPMSVFGAFFVLLGDLTIEELEAFLKKTTPDDKNAKAIALIIKEGG